MFLDDDDDDLLYYNNPSPVLIKNGCWLLDYIGRQATVLRVESDKEKRDEEKQSVHVIM